MLLEAQDWLCSTSAVWFVTYSWIWRVHCTREWGMDHVFLYRLCNFKLLVICKIELSSNHVIFKLYNHNFHTTLILFVLPAVATTQTPRTVTSRSWVSFASTCTNASELFFMKCSVEICFVPFCVSNRCLCRTALTAVATTQRPKTQTPRTVTSRPWVWCFTNLCVM